MESKACHAMTKNQFVLVCFVQLRPFSSKLQQFSLPSFGSKVMLAICFALGGLLGQHSLNSYNIIHWRLLPDAN
jgi:hypothetical protein